MSNSNMNQSGVPAPTLAMRANAPVFSTEDRPHEDRGGGNSEQSIVPTYPTSFRANVPTAERTLHPLESTALSQSISVPGNDRLINARQAATKLASPSAGSATTPRAGHPESAA